MINIIDHRRQPPARKCVKDIPIGTYFTGSLYQEGLHVRTYDGIVLLSDPNSTWNISPALMVDNYQPVDVTITINANVVISDDAGDNDDGL